jgi:alkaline phosphatase
MKKNLTMFLIMVLTFLSSLSNAYEPQDVVYEDCSKKQVVQADCSGFSSETQPKNVIIFIQDGVGINQIWSSRVYQNGVETKLEFEKFPYQSLVKTCSLSGVTDSAAASTALATGHKTQNGKLGIGPLNQKLTNITELAKKAGKAVGIVTTDELPGATPAGFVVKINSRTKYGRIAELYLESAPELLMGGGRKWFQKQTSSSEQASIIYADAGKTISKAEGAKSKDLLKQASSLGYNIIFTREGLNAYTPEWQKVLGLFSIINMPYAMDRSLESPEPTMEEMARFTLNFLARDPDGFFLMFESSNTDEAGHSVDQARVIDEIIAFEKVVKVALEFQKTHPDTLILVTSDHETGGMEVIPGNYQKGEYVAIKWTTKIMPIVPALHSSQRVPLYGAGPSAELVEKVNDNTEIFCIMKQAINKP